MAPIFVTLLHRIKKLVVLGFQGFEDIIQFLESLGLKGVKGYRKA
jgi:hypothetical protein